VLHHLLHAASNTARIRRHLRCLRAALMCLVGGWTEPIQLPFTIVAAQICVAERFAWKVGAPCAAYQAI
jgi:hypothetical protein